MFKDSRPIPLRTTVLPEEDHAWTQDRARLFFHPLVDNGNNYSDLRKIVIEATRRSDVNAVREKLGEIIGVITTAGIEEEFFDQIDDTGSFFAYEPSALRLKDQKPTPLTENALILTTSGQIVRITKNLTTNRRKVTQVSDADLLLHSVALADAMSDKARLLLFSQLASVTG